MKGGVAMLVSALLRVAAVGGAARRRRHPRAHERRGGGQPARMKFLVEEHAELFDGVRYALSEFGGFTQWHGERRLRPDPGRREAALPDPRDGPWPGRPRGVGRARDGEREARPAPLCDWRRVGFRCTSRPSPGRCSRRWRRRLPLHERLALRATARPARLPTGCSALLGAAGRAARPLLHNTATPTVVRGGNSTNVIPTELSVDLDGRVLPGHVAARARRRARGARDRTRDVRARPRGAGRSRRTGSRTLLAARRRHPWAGRGMRADPDAAPGLHGRSLLQQARDPDLRLPADAAAAAHHASTSSTRPTSECRRRRSSSASTASSTRSADTGDQLYYS